MSLFIMIAILVETNVTALSKFFGSFGACSANCSTFCISNSQVMDGCEPAAFPKYLCTCVPF